MIKKIIGGGLIATPFVALFIFLVIQASLLVAVIIYGMVCVVFGLITAGVMLGDGYTVVLHCEYAEEIDEYTPDDGVVLCPIQVER